MSMICCVCQQGLSNYDNNKKNIFEDDLLIQSVSDERGRKFGSEKKIKIVSAIEVITRQTVVAVEGTTKSSMCSPCFEKLEDFMNFRLQLLFSFGTIYDVETSFNALQRTSPESEAEEEDSEEDSDLDYFTGKTLDRPNIPDEVDENSTSPDSPSIQNDESIANGSTNCRTLQNYEDNNILSLSETSSENIDGEETLVKVHNNDIESEIDVCSGEDDEILEFEGETKKDNSTEVPISSETEIEVCDYEPTGKKIKNSNSSP